MYDDKPNQIPLSPNRRYERLVFTIVTYMQAPAQNMIIFAKVEVNSDGYLPSCFGEVNIHHSSPTQRQLIILVYTTQL